MAGCSSTSWEARLRSFADRFSSGQASAGVICQFIAGPVGSMSSVSCSVVSRPSICPYSSNPGISAALFFLGVAWWVTVSAAVIAIKQHRIEAHKTWMIRGYVVTVAFVTFRWWLNWPFWSALGSDRLAVVAWLSWTVPLLLTEFVVRSRRALPLRRPAD